MAYTTETKVEALYGISIDTTVFNSLLASTKSFIDRYCGKTFEGASGDKYFDGDGRDVLNVDSFYGTATVSILNHEGDVEITLTEGANNDFVTGPYNSTEKNQIILTANGSRSCFPNRIRSVKITATWGFSATVPSDIELVATKMIGEIYKTAQGNAAAGAIKSEELGDYAISYADSGGTTEAAQKISATNILDQYRDLDI